MAERTTLARPYAQAVFDLARRHNEMPAWSEQLQLLAQVAGDANVQRLIAGPRVNNEQRVSVIAEIGGAALGERAVNLLRVLAENRRLGVLREIAELYEAYRAEAERSMTAEVISAFPVSEDLQRQLTEALTKRLGRDISLSWRTDENLIGGAIIRAGDLVIDGSVTGKLGKLSAALSH